MCDRHEEKMEMLDLVNELLETLQKHEPAIAVAAASQAFGNAIICSTVDQAAALKRLSICVSAITETFEEYQLEKFSHWKQD